MNKIIVLFIIGITIGCNSCSQNNTTEELITKQINEKYKNALIFFGKSKTDHFPNNLKDKNSLFTSSFSPELGNLELVLYEPIEETQLIKTRNWLDRKSIAKYRGSDSCLLVVNRFVSREKHYKVQPTEKELVLVDLDCYSGLFPIPNFWHNNFTTEETYSRLPADFSIYVLEAKAGKNFQEDYLTDGKFMPIKWKNGYSKGIAISESRKAIIYWLIIW